MTKFRVAMVATVVVSAIILALAWASASSSA
jgi:hypothetical protein